MKPTSLATSLITLVALGTAVLPLVANAAQDAHQVPIKKPVMMSSSTRSFIEREDARPTRATSGNMPPATSPKRENASSTLPRPQALMRENASSTTRIEMREQKRDALLMKAKDRADQEIDRRITALEAFTARVGNIHMSDSDKNELQATMKGQIESLSALKEKIADDTSTSTLKEAVQSITKSHRVFALVIPQGAITAAADRVNQVTAQMQQLSTKLETRINEARAKNHDTQILTTTLADLNAKVADAITQAGAAVTLVKALLPDNGNETILKANKTALQDANKKIKTAEQDLQKARKDAESIVKGLRAFGPANTSPTASTTITQ